MQISGVKWSSVAFLYIETPLVCQEETILVSCRTAAFSCIADRNLSTVGVRKRREKKRTKTADNFS
jgi:hypothetical protein